VNRRHREALASGRGGADRRDERRRPPGGEVRGAGVCLVYLVNGDCLVRVEVDAGQREPGRLTQRISPKPADRLKVIRNVTKAPFRI
jgi:hypothetical protein